MPGSLAATRLGRRQGGWGMGSGPGRRVGRKLGRRVEKWVRKQGTWGRWAGRWGSSAGLGLLSGGRGGHRRGAGRERMDPLPGWGCLGQLLPAGRVQGRQGSGARQQAGCAAALVGGCWGQQGCVGGGAGLQPRSAGPAHALLCQDGACCAERTVTSAAPPGCAQRWVLRIRCKDLVKWTCSVRSAAEWLLNSEQRTAA